MFSQLTAILNNFIKYNLITFTFIKIFYKCLIKKVWHLLKVEDLNLNSLIKIFIIISLKAFE